MEEEIQIFDLQRMFVGEHPPAFLLEIIIRTAIMYLYTIFLFRILGKRGMGQISSLELAIIICFGSAAGDPMVYHDMPITYGILAITIVALLQLATEKIINQSPKLEKITEGEPECLVKDGIIQLDILKKEQLSHADLFRALREKDVSQLGEVRRAFFETSGKITVFLQAKGHERQGLDILPDEDYKPHEVNGLYTPGGEGKWCCANCGSCVVDSANTAKLVCEVCGESKWVRAVEC
jgi:Predicted membrane protein